MVLTEAISSANDGDMYISIQIVVKYLKCVKISWLLSNITITSSVIYIHKYLHTIKVMVVE